MQWAVLTGVIMLLLPFGLIISQWSGHDRGTGAPGLDFGRLPVADAPAATPESWRAPDGAILALRRYPSAQAEAPLVVMIHGSGWHGLQFDQLAKRLAATGLADVLVPDLRGHGENPAQRGDIAYIGQFEDDLAALIEAEKRPGQPVIALGHSSGGGLVVRFAGGNHGALLGGAVLMAPFLGHSAATTRPNSGGWARPLVRRIIGLAILNRLGFRALNGLKVIQFRFPDAVLDGPLGHTATRAYSYRLNTSYAPRADLAADAEALPPFLLIAGEQDEAFIAAQYQPTLTAITDKGTYALIPDAGHLDVVDSESSFQALVGWLGKARR